ncbi:MAG: asparagine synthase-related protein [Vicinamibacterales bacterium]
MTGLFGWLPAAPGDHRAVLHAMGAALATHPGERWSIAPAGGGGVGVLDGVDPGRVAEWTAPVGNAAGDCLWVAGEIFDMPGVTLARPQDAATRPAREALLARLTADGPRGLRAVDGEFQVAWWDAARRELRLLSDRFGGLPWYWARSPQGVAFACGVRGVLAAPGMDQAPDEEALRDAMTFGGYRLGDRTNVAAVRMLPPALDARATAAGIDQRRYWTWADIPARDVPSIGAGIDEAHGLWQQAVGRRLRGAERPGQTLSGGLDSRAILAEAAPRAPRWTAITYGVAGCEDARLARRAARAMGAEWRFQPLYAGDWLATRAGVVQATDGLIDLHDLGHLESLDLQRACLDMHLSGYIGDAVAGPTFASVSTADAALLALPYYETPVSRGWAGALARLGEATADPAWVPTRFALFEHKLPQSTNRWTAAWRPWLRVRKPFTDYALFDFWQGLPARRRVEDRLYDRWLARAYPPAFGRIPVHRTGAPLLAPPWRVQAARAGRGARRAWLSAARRWGLPHRPWSRGYTDDEAYWGTPSVRERMRETVLRPGSVAVATFGRAAVADLLDAWFSRQAAPAQVVGALFTYEHYHAGLAAHVEAARARGRALHLSERETPC